MCGSLIINSFNNSTYPVYPLLSFWASLFFILWFSLIILCRLVFIVPIGQKSMFADFTHHQRNLYFWRFLFGMVMSMYPNQVHNWLNYTHALSIFRFWHIFVQWEGRNSMFYPVILRVIGRPGMILTWFLTFSHVKFDFTIFQLTESASQQILTCHVHSLDTSRQPAVTRVLGTKCYQRGAIRIKKSAFVQLLACQWIGEEPPWIIGDSGFIGSLVKDNLLQTYCCSWYGSQTWDMNSKHVCQLNVQ